MVVYAILYIKKENLGFNYREKRTIRSIGTLLTQDAIQ